MSNVVVNRTSEFRHARDEIRRRQEIFKVATPDHHTHNAYQSITQRSPGGDGDVELVALNPPTDERMPKWLVDIEAAHCSLDALKAELGAFQRLQSQHLMNVFNKNLRSAIQDIMLKSNEVSAQVRDTEAKITTLRACSANTDPMERTIRLNASRCVAKSFEELSGIFRKKQNFYVEELRKRDILPSKARQQDDSSTVAMSDDQQQQQQQALLESDRVTQATQIDQMLTTMQDVEVMFEQTRSLAIEQGTMLDRIDVNVEQAIDNTERGHVILRKIEDRQRHGFVKQVSKILFCIDLVLALLVVIKWWPR